MQDEKNAMINEILVALRPFMSPGAREDVRFAITMAAAPYAVSKEETALTVWDGDRNQLIMKKFLSAKIAAGCSMRTVKFYQESISGTLLKIGKNYDEVTADDVRLYLAKRVHQDGVSKTSADNERRNLSAFYGWLQREEILTRNPMQKVDRIKITKVKKKAFSPMEIEKLRGACRTNRERALIEILLSTWCRVSEVCSIKVSDISESDIRVRGKGDKERDVYLNAKAVFALQQYLQERVDRNPYLFPGRNALTFSKIRSYGESWYLNADAVTAGEPMDVSSLEALVRNLGRRAGVENVHPHRFRRTGATAALRQGMPILEVSKLLGHESIATTQIYLDISDEELLAAHTKYVV